MATNGIVGSLNGLWRFPVKSMRGEQLQESEVTSRGLVGDRVYALIDNETGKVVSAKSVKLFPDILKCQATFIKPPNMGLELPSVRITLPNGIIVDSDSGSIDRELSAYFRRDVTLARSAPDDYTIDQYHPDMENIDPAGYRDTIVEQKLGSAFYAQAGLVSPVPAGSFFDLFPMSVLTTSTLNRLNELQPQSSFDQRRFRMNVIVEAKKAGFVENEWVGHRLAIGNQVQLSISMPDPRCVMTTLAQNGLPKDNDILRALTRYNRINIDGGPFPCAGVYAVVEAIGTLKIGDEVAVI